MKTRSSSIFYVITLPLCLILFLTACTSNGGEKDEEIIGGPILNNVGSELDYCGLYSLSECEGEEIFNYAEIAEDGNIYV